MANDMTPHSSQRESQSSTEYCFEAPRSWRSTRHSQQDEDVSRMMENSESQGSELMTQNELSMTQNELTQLGDFEEEGLSPLAPQSPLNPKSVPWGRLIPCSSARQSGGIDLLPKEVVSEQSQQDGGVSFLGLDNLKSSDVFNEYVLGRSNKCDIIAAKPPQDEEVGKDTTALQDWAHAMISNRHCRIYCVLKQQPAEKQDMEVYMEDTSGNGTLINSTTLLRRGEKRILHTGDEICLVNPTTLRKKIRSNAMLTDLQRQHSYIFVNVFQQQGQQHDSILASVRQRQSSMRPPSSVKQLRKGPVDVRAMNNHSFGRPSDARPQRLMSPRTSRNKQPRVEEEYDIRDLLGSGTCGEVRRAIHRHSGQQYAVKIIPLGGRNRANAFTDVSAAFEAEASILKSLDHPYVVKLVDVFVSPGQAVYLVMEMLQGDLFDRIVQKGKYSEDESRRVMRRLLNALFYLHEVKNVVHRDLKPENILCVSRDSDIDLKLTDFGLARHITEDGLKTFCGTPQYFAPEVLRRRHTIAGVGRYDKKADVWSLGIILYILLSGSPPFDVSQGLDSVVDAKIVFPAERWAGVSEEAKDLVRKLLMADPKNRISVKDACKHGWILTEDGDTHTYPLDDPAVAHVLGGGGQPLLSNRKLFARDESVPQQETNARRSIMDEPKDEDSSQTTDADEGKRTSRVVRSLNESIEARAAACSKSTASETIESEDTTTPSHETKTTETPMSSQGTLPCSNAATASAALPPTRVSIATKLTDNSDTDKSASKAPRILLPSLSISNDPKPNGDHAASARDGPDDKEAIPRAFDTPAAQASNHLPLSLNARSNKFRDLVVKNVESDAPKTTGADPSQANADEASAVRKISPEEKRSSASSKGKVVPNRLSSERATQAVVERKADKKPKKTKRKVKVSSVESRAAELSEDEICSEFSDDGDDSIDSFGEGENGADAKDSKRPASDGSGAPTQKPRKKRRIVFGQLGRSAAAAAASEQDDGVEVSDEDVTTRKKSNATKVKSKAKETKKTKESKSETTGGRQTTLSSWFRKPM